MRKNIKRNNKILKVDYNTWNNIVNELSDIFVKETHEINDILEIVLSNENINKILKTNKQQDNIIEITNEPKTKNSTLYNTLSFIEEYEEKILRYYSSKGLMRIKS